MEHLNLIRKVAWNFAEKTGEQFEDLLSEAYFAYTKAQQNYNPDKGAKFTTYAYQCIHNHLINISKQKHRDQIKENQFVVRAGDLPIEAHPGQEIREKLESVIEEWPEDCQNMAELVLGFAEGILGQTPNFKRTDSTPKQRVKSHLRAQGWSHSRVQQGMRDMRDLVNNLGG